MSKYDFTESICFTCKNTHKKKCSWFNPDNMDVPDGAKCLVRKNQQKDIHLRKTTPWHIKIVECPNYKKERGTKS